MARSLADAHSRRISPNRAKSIRAVAAAVAADAGDTAVAGAAAAVVPPAVTDSNTWGGLWRGAGCLPDAPLRLVGGHSADWIGADSYPNCRFSLRTLWHRRPGWRAGTRPLPREMPQAWQSRNGPTRGNRAPYHPATQFLLRSSSAATRLPRAGGGDNSR